MTAAIECSADDCGHTLHADPDNPQRRVCARGHVEILMFGVRDALARAEETRRSA